MSQTILTRTINGKEAKFLLIVNDANNIDKRVFLSSENIDIFPCSRRGRSKDNTIAYDPEARLNTERTNRLSTAINGFTDSFIDNFDSKNNTLTFVLAGYRVEARNFNPANIAKELGAKTDDKIYAHLSLHDKVSLMVTDYFTEILYRQSTEENDANSLDVTITDSDFFVGISFTTKSDCTDILIAGNRELDAYNLPIFTVTELGDTELAQASLLPKIEHGETENSIKIKGDFTVSQHVNIEGSLDIADKATLKNGLEVTSGDTTLEKLSAKATDVASLTVEGDTSLKSTVIFGTVDITGDVEVNNNISTATLNATTEINTPQLTASKLTSKDTNTEIEVDRTLKVDTINSDSTNGLTVKQAATLEKTLTVEGTTTVNDTITTEKLIVTSVVNEIDDVTGEYVEVDKGEVITPTLQVNRLTTNSESIIVDDKNLVVTKSLEVLAAKAVDEENRETAATAAIDKAVIGQLEVKADATKLTESTGKITAKEIWLKDIGQVPTLELAYLGATDTYQLRFKFGTPITIKEE